MRLHATLLTCRRVEGEATHSRVALALDHAESFVMASCSRLGLGNRACTKTKIGRELHRSAWDTQVGVVGGLIRIHVPYIYVTRLVAECLCNVQ